MSEGGRNQSSPWTKYQKIVAGQTYIFNENQKIKNSPSQLIDCKLYWHAEKRFRYWKYGYLSSFKDS